MTDDPEETPVPGKTETIEDPTLSGAPGVPVRPGPATDPQQRIGTTIGPYRLLRRIGAGGMGDVYLAEQTAPVRRQVALKVIKLGMDTEQVVKRFESERQALALMDHPAIARVLDAGSTPEGRPYFVMEYVPGVPITAHCDAHRLSVRERLELFIEVCAGIQHAHQKAVIHRDIKPSNILVSVHDGRALPKIIDFGVAKATAHRLTEQTLFTELGQVVGTPEYMSPEQAEATGLEVDTRTDVYSLGIVLYELLVGSLPFDVTALRQAGLLDIQRRIREYDPPRPSTRVKDLGERTTGSAADRRTDPVHLVSELRGDLDWITLKALEKERARRYESPSALAADLRRYLADEPVEASPPSALYRARKFVRRHRAGVAFGSVVLALVVAFAAALGWQAARVVEERDRANLEAATAREVSDFLVGLFEGSDPWKARGNEITAREILDRGAEEIRRDLAGQPLTQARLMATMGQVYSALGLYDAARPLIEGALEVRERELPPDHLDLAESLALLGDLESQAARYDRARSLYQRELAIRQAVLGESDPTVADTLSSLGHVEWRSGSWDLAQQLHERALAIREETLGPGDPAVANSLWNLGIVAADEGENERALELYERALRIAETAHGPEAPQTASILNSMALVLDNLGQDERALALHDRVLAIRRSALEADHPDIAFTLHNKGRLLADMGDAEGARALYEEALDIRKRALGPDHAQVGMTLESLAILIARSGDLAAAEPLFERALEINEAVLGPTHVETLESLQNLAILAMHRGQSERALRLLTSATERGYAQPEVLEDEVFDPVRADARFVEIRAAVERNAERGVR